MKKIIQLEGLDCAGCAAELEAKIAALDGVSSASLAFVNQKLTVEYDAEQTLEKVLYVANHFEEVHVVDEKDRGSSALTDKKTLSPERKKRRLEWILIAFSSMFFVGGILLEYLAQGLAAEICSYVCYGIAYFSVGYPVLFSTAKNICKGKIFDENFLMTIASVGAVLLGEYFEGVAVMLLYQIGETLQGMAVASSRRSVSALMELKSEWATVFKGREQKKVTPEEICVGDILFVKAGEKVPVDGVLIDAKASLDTKSLTGESEIRMAKTGEELLSGCINVGAAFTMRATRPYQDSAVGKILYLVENASSGKAAPEKFITKFARWYTPVVCILAVALAVIAPLINGLVANNQLHFYNFERWVQSALTFLVISCPCALIITVPLTYFSGIGACASKGILVKGATYLDVLAQAKIFAFDKTGTLTEGNFTVCGVYAENVAEEELLALVSSAEKTSAHPIAKAFEKVAAPYAAKNAEERAGRGIAAEINGENILVGNARLLQENGVTFTERESVYTVVYAAKDGKYIGCVEVGDRLREEAKGALKEITKQGVKRLVMLTGDNIARAQKIANEVGMYEVNAALLPDEKLQKAEELKKDGTLVYVGDGVNDAPVMAVADCAVSMGKLGSAAAVETADLVLISDDLSALPRALHTAKKTRRIVMQNIIFSIVMKVAFMALGTMGILPLVAAVFADVGVMLLAVLNSFRVRK